jgi:mRNA interferase RelE/StbE
LSNSFTIAETASFQKLHGKPHFKILYNKIKDFIYPQLRENPFFGPNIKKLKGDLSHYYRYRIGDYRLFYQVDTSTGMVFIVSMRDRKAAY